MRERRSSTPNSPVTGRILGAAGIAMIAIVVIGVVLVLVNRPGAQTTAEPAGSPSRPPATSMAKLPRSSEPPIENEHSEAPDDTDVDGREKRPDRGNEQERAKPSPSPKPTRTSSPTPTPPAPTQDSGNAPEQPRPGITSANLPAAEDLQWRTAGEWREVGETTDFGDRPPSVCLPSVTVLANPTTMLRRDFVLPDRGHATAVVVDYASHAEAEESYAELGRSVRDCPGMLRQQGYLQPSPVAVKPVPLPEGIVSEHLKLEYQERHGKPTTESIGLIRAGNRVLMLSMVTPADDTSWAKGPDGQPQGQPMLRTIPTAAGRLIA